jgi:hypothetical protein
MRVIRKQINKRIINMKKLLMGLIVALPMTAGAVTVTVTPTCGSIGGTTSSGNCKAMTDEINSQLNEDLPQVSIGEYGTGLANTNSFAYKGLDSDYSDAFTYFMVRGGLGAAIQGDIDEAQENPMSLSGVGVGAAVTAGINLDILPINRIGPIDLSKMDLMVSLMSYNLDQDQDDMNIKGDIGHFSIMARYQVMEGIDIFPGYMLEWGGIYLHTGFHRQSFKADLTQTFEDKKFDIAGGETATGKDASARFGLETATTTIPIEISTFLRAGYAFTFFGGAGFDIVNGTTDVDLNAGGKIEGDGTTYEAEISASESDSGDADATNFRAFGGLQFNLPFFRLTTHVNKGLGNDLIGVNAAIKILW